MDNETAQQFYKQVGQVCEKFGIGAFVGWWAGSHGSHDGNGSFSYYNPIDLEMKQAATIMHAMIERYELPAESTAEIRVTIESNGKRN